MLNSVRVGTTRREEVNEKMVEQAKVGEDSTHF